MRQVQVFTDSIMQLIPLQKKLQSTRNLKRTLYNSLYDRAVYLNCLYFSVLHTNFEEMFLFKHLKGSVWLFIEPWVPIMGPFYGLHFNFNAF